MARDRETLPQLRERFEAWFKMTRPLWNDGKDTTLKHQLWTAWQVAHLGDTANKSTPDSRTTKREV